MEDPAASGSSSPVDAVLVTYRFAARMFSLYVTLLWTEKPTAVGRNGKGRAPKQQSRTKVHPHTIPMLTYTREEFVHAILTAHGLHNRFQAHAQSGPDFQISWKGSVYVSL